MSETWAAIPCRAGEGKGEEVGVVKAFLGCNTDNFVKALDRIDREYGSMEAYLKGLMGLSDEDLCTLRQRFTPDKTFCAEVLYKEECQ